MKSLFPCLIRHCDTGLSGALGLPILYKLSDLSAERQNVFCQIIYRFLIVKFASAAAAIVRLSGKLDTCLDDAQSSQQQLQQSPTCHALCLGLGAGSLPLFLSHHFPGMLVQAVELDPVVIAAATQEMGLPAKRYRGLYLSLQTLSLTTLSLGDTCTWNSRFTSGNHAPWYACKTHANCLTPKANMNICSRHAQHQC